jgi:hypothetical protein
VDRLAIVSGVPALALKHAVADLDGAGLPPTYRHYDGDRSVMIRPQVSGPACQLCAAAQGATAQVTCWRPAEKVICMRHCRWTGSAGSDQPNLGLQPDILRAHRQHLRLVRRFGRNEVTAAFTIAAGMSTP